MRRLRLRRRRRLGRRPPHRRLHRRLRRRLRRPRRPGLSLLAACAILGTVAALPPFTPLVEASDAPAQLPARKVLVVRADAVCPEVRSDKDTQSRVSIAAPGLVGETGTAQAGGAGDARLPDYAPVEPRARLTDLDADASHLSLTRPGSELLTLRGEAPKARARRSLAMAASAQGALAPGFGASVVTRSTRGDLRGLASTACAPAGTDFWFVGSGAVVGQRGRLYLTNPASAPAEVDIDLYGPEGAIKLPAARGVTVAAGSQEVLLLDALSPATVRFGIHVQVRQGRIAAALRDHQVRGLDPRGIDWVPAASPPARRVVVPGVPGGAGERSLHVLAPGEADAIVRVRLLAEDGPFVPSGADLLEVRAGSVAELDLAQALGRQEMAVELTSDVPITAGVLARAVAAKGQLEELAYTAAADEVTSARPALVTPASGGRPTKTRLLLAAPRGAATVTVSPLAPVRGSPTVVTVPDGAQVSVELARVSRADDVSVVVVPEPGSGPVVGSRVIEETGRSGRLLTISPLTPGRYHVRVPQVVADLSTGLGAGRCTPGC